MDTAVTASDSKPASSGALRTARLLEQLLQIARASVLEEMASGVAHELNHSSVITLLSPHGEIVMQSTVLAKADPDLLQAVSGIP
jgi:hypothetical protein